MEVPFFRHALDESDIECAADVLRSPFITTGFRTEQFEGLLASRLLCREAVGVMSCTHALFLALSAWGVGPGDEVIVPAMTFVASASVVSHVGATPILCDVEAKTGLIDLDAAEGLVNERTRVLLVVHLYGQMVDMQEARRVADRNGLRLLEDSAHCIEGERDGVGPGQLGDAACFSFYATKNITSAEGGAVVSNDIEFCDRVRRMRLHGMSKNALHRYTGRYEHWDVAEFGYKANMTDVQAAMLSNQLERLEVQRLSREATSRRYEEVLNEAGIDYPLVLPECTSARHLFTMWAPAACRDEVLASLQDSGIGVAVNFRSLTKLTVFAKDGRFTGDSCPRSDLIGSRTVSLPLFPFMTDDEVEYAAICAVRAVEGCAVS